MENFNKNKQTGIGIIETIESIQTINLKDILISFTKKDIKTFFQSFYVEIKRTNAEDFILNTLKSYTEYLSIMDSVRSLTEHRKKNNEPIQHIISKIKSISMIHKESNIVFFQKKYN